MIEIFYSFSKPLKEFIKENSNIGEISINGKCVVAKVEDF